MANKKGLIPFGGLGKQLRATKGSGNALGALRQQTGVAAKKPVNSLAAMQTAVEQRNAISSIVYGLDYTASTNDVVDEFQKVAGEIATQLNEEFGNPDQYFGIYHGKRDIVMGGPGDKSPLNSHNHDGESDVPTFVVSVLENQLQNEDNSIIFIFGDEVDLRDNYEGRSNTKIDKISQTLREKKSPLFFIYTQTEYGNHSRKQVEDILIKPLGEYGYLLDMTEVDVDKLVDIIKGCVAYSVKSKVPAAATGGHKISLQDYLKKVGASGLKISQGEAPKQLGHF